MAMWLSQFNLICFVFLWTDDAWYSGHSAGRGRWESESLRAREPRPVLPVSACGAEPFLLLLDVSWGSHLAEEWGGRKGQPASSLHTCSPSLQGEDVFIPLTLGNWRRKRLATEGWNTCYWIIVAFNVATLQVLKGFSVLFHFVHVWKIICRNELCLQGLHSSRELKKNPLDQLNSFSFIFPPSLPCPSLQPSFPSCSALQYVTGNELQNNAILTCFLLKCLSSKLLYLKKYGWGH